MRTIRSTFFVSALLATAIAHADVAYTSFGPGDGYDLSSGYTIATATSQGGYQSGAMQLTSATTGSLLSVTVPVIRISGTGALFVGFYSDAGNDVGTPLASWTTTISGQTVRTLTAPAGIPIVAGAKYWVGLIAQDNSYLAWNNTSPAINGPYAVNYDTQSGSVSGQISAFRVETQAVPEPGTLAALGLGAAALLRRRKRA